MADTRPPVCPDSHADTQTPSAAYSHVCVCVCVCMCVCVQGGVLRPPNVQANVQVRQLKLVIVGVEVTCVCLCRWLVMRARSCCRCTRPRTCYLRGRVCAHPLSAHPSIHCCVCLHRCLYDDQDTSGPWGDDPHDDNGRSVHSERGPTHRRNAGSQAGRNVWVPSLCVCSEWYEDESTAEHHLELIRLIPQARETCDDEMRTMNDKHEGYSFVHRVCSWRPTPRPIHNMPIGQWCSMSAVGGMDTVTLTPSTYSPTHGGACVSCVYVCVCR